MTTTITKTIEFDAGHRVPHHTSKCFSPHGHRYKVEVEVAGPVQPADGRADGGMVVDFGVIKTLLVTYVHDMYDHRTIIWQHDDVMLAAFDQPGWNVTIVSLVPTAENLAAMIFDTLDMHLTEHGLELVRVTVWETPTCSAIATR